jgi:hypothetical protein
LFDSLSTAREWAGRIRYGDDVSVVNASEFDGVAARRYRDHLLQSSLLVNAVVTPEIEKVVVQVCDRLEVPRDAVQVYVYDSPVIQAECTTLNASLCVLRLTSRIVELLSFDELEFVVGHEIAHFLLCHGGQSESEKRDLESSSRSRSQEISADRLGLIACNSLDHALRAIMKSISGLSDKYIRFDTSEFLGQLQKTKSLELSRQSFSSHPSMLVRFRALMQFSMTNVLVVGARGLTNKSLSDLDAQVENDLLQYVDNITPQLTKVAKQDVMMWLAVQKIVELGAFNKREQEKFIKYFGSETTGKLISLLTGMEMSELRRMAASRLEEAVGELRRIIPSRADAVYADIMDGVASNFMDDDHT